MRQQHQKSNAATKFKGDNNMIISTDAEKHLVKVYIAVNTYNGL